MSGKITRVLLGSLIGFAACTTFAAETLKAGDPLPTLALTDQHEKPAPISPDTRHLIFAAEKGASEMVTTLLDSKGAAWLKQTGGVYLADIHAMPGLVSRMFALPKLREKPYPIVLGRNEPDLAMIPHKKDCVTLIAVQDGKLGEVRYACTSDELKAGVPK